MDTLTCDICGGKLVGSAGGLFVCQHCGMEYTTDRIKEKVQEIKGEVVVSGVVNVDSSHLLDNYLNMAKNAIETENYQEAEQYCNKILEVYPTHSETWFLKGRAAGWQSKIENPRFTEAVNCFIKAFENANEEEIDDLKSDISMQVENLSKALITVRCERFAEFPDGEEAAGFVKDLKNIINMKIQLVQGTGIFIEGYDITVALMILKSVTYAFTQKIYPEYVGNDGFPSEWQFENFLLRTDTCINVLEMISNLENISDDAVIQVYKMMITLQEKCIDSCSYSYQTVQVGNSWVDGSPMYETKQLKDKELTEKAKDLRRKLIIDYQVKIELINNKRKQLKEQEEAKKQAKIKAAKEEKIAAFWSKYPEVKKQILDEIKELQSIKNKNSANNTGVKQNEIISKRIEQLELILNRDRHNSSVLQEKELLTINHSSEFRKEIDTAIEYDEYLDAYPILKRKSTLEKNYSELNKKHQKEINEYETKKNSAVLGIVLPPIGIALFLIATFALNGLFILAAILCGIGFAVKIGEFKEFTKTKETLLSTKEKLNSISKELNEIKEIPSYEIFKDKGKLKQYVEEKENDLKTAREKEIKDRRKKKTTVILVCVVISAILLFFIILSNVIIPSIKYNNAVSLIESGNYSEALSAFKSVKTYKDSNEYLSRLKVCYDKKTETSDGDVDEYYYDSKGNLTKEISIYSDGDVYETHYENSYDNNGNLIMTITKYSDGDINHIYEYGYDSSNNLIKTVEKEFDGAINNTIEYSYDGNDNLIKTIEKDSDGDVYYTIEYRYNWKNELVEEIKTYSDGDKTIHEYNYDNKGNLVNEIYMGCEDANDEGEVICTYKYSYDGNNNLIKKEQVNSEGYVDYSAKYSYDDIGNMLEETNTDGKFVTYNYEGVRVLYLP